jgi:pimeloyl-ACP methyl ester carboxylesterase
MQDSTVQPPTPIPMHSESPQGLPSQRSYFAGANCQLSAIEFGDSEQPPMILLHGMRDHGLSMTSIVSAFQDSHRILALDLRGHGHSDNPGSYAMVQFVADLRALVKHFQLDRATTPPILMGHSLGGHIVSRYAAAYPQEVRALVLLDGMGPPRAAEVADEQALQQRWRDQVESIVGLSGDLKTMRDPADALSRLIRNNPRLAVERARQIVEAGIEAHPDGGIRWRWDPMMNMVWQTFSSIETEQQMRWFDCPVLIVTGEDALQYWIAAGHLGPQGSEALYAAELQRRQGLFADARHVVIPQAGHMLHYDQPDQLNVTLRAFVDSLSTQDA